jgi:hypothetical protein
MQHAMTAPNPKGFHLPFHSVAALFPSPSFLLGLRVLKLLTAMSISGVYSAAEPSAAELCHLLLVLYHIKPKISDPAGC